MKISKYESLISENVAPYEATEIGIYSSNGNRVGGFKLQNLRLPRLGEKIYSFGALSDIHLQYSTAQEDFQRALTFLNETEDVEFTCICGDLTDNGEDADFETYIEYVNTYSPNTPVYECTGNHDAYDNLISFDRMQPYTGHDLYYTFTQGDDLFIMFGTQWYDTTGQLINPFTNESLQWLYEILEANRNKRVFLFQHYLRFDGSGKPYSPNPTGDVLSYCTQGTVFMSLMEHYTNVVWFHGHSHTKFDCQEDCSYANYDRLHGCHSIHIPSLAVPRDYENDAYVTKYAESEGYVVDVYKNHIVLRGRDFVKEEFLPIATYCIDTTLVEIEANSFTDSTGTINVFEEIVDDLAVAVRQTLDLNTDGTLNVYADNPRLILASSTANECSWATRESSTVYMMPIPEKASKVTVVTTDTTLAQMGVKGYNYSDGVYTQMFDSGWLTDFTYTFGKGVADYIVIIFETTDRATSVAWGYDVNANMTVTFN